MQKKQTAVKVVKPTNLVTESTITIHGRYVERDTELSIRGVSGRCRFIEQVTNTNNGSTWITVISAAKQWRSFSPDRVTTVHRVTKTRENADG